MSPFNATIHPRPAHARTRQSQASQPPAHAILAHLQSKWKDCNDKFFQGKLSRPTIVFAKTAARSRGHCRRDLVVPDAIQIVLAERLVFGASREVRQLWPAEGHVRFVEDLLLHEMVHQYILELRLENKSYGGHGPSFCRRCNQIGEKMGLRAVTEKRRGPQQKQWPLASQWPHNVRPHGYYLDHVKIQPLPHLPSGFRRRKTDYRCILERIESLLATEDYETLQALVRDEQFQLQEARHLYLPINSVFSAPTEKG